MSSPPTALPPFYTPERFRIKAGLAKAEKTQPRPVPRREFGKTRKHLACKRMAGSASPVERRGGRQLICGRSDDSITRRRTW